MVLENPVPPFLNWFAAALITFLVSAGVLIAGALAISFVIMAFRYGPMTAADIIYRALRVGLIELIQMSPRRIWAIARLAIQESIRRRVLVVLVVFIIVLMFANWFLDRTSNDPGRLYITFTLTTASYLVLVIGLFLAAFSLPTDIKNRTIYSVVTKPVRPGEILLGRILGFSLIGTALLSVMGLFSYIFISRALSHTHEIDVANLKTVGSGEKEVLTGLTSSEQNHRHEVTIYPDGTGSTDLGQGHWHEITSRERDGKKTYVLSSPQGQFQARVPIYGDLRFTDRSGLGIERGVSVGSEWGYRSYVEGGTLASAIWTFTGLKPEDFPNGLPLELNLRVFRTHKGEIKDGDLNKILGSLKVRNPQNQTKCLVRTFPAKDFEIDEQTIPLELTGEKGKKLDLFKDLVTSDGRLEIIVECVDPQQYFGVAKADLYMRSQDNSFALNFIKGLVGDWFKMVFVVCIGVMFSTFLSGPVAMLATLSAIVLGFYRQDVIDLATNQVLGGGPIESSIRLFKQQNLMTEMEEGLTTTVIKTVDGWMMYVVHNIASLLPDLSQIENVNYVANGYNIPGDMVGIQAVSALGYLTGVFVIGYFFLKTREMAK